MKLSAVFMGVVGGVLGAHAGIPAHQNPVLTTPTTAGGSGGSSITVGSVVFSPDERHHAYVATDAGDAIMLDGKERVPLPPGATVEWMRFDSTSQVLVARLRGEASPLVVPLAGALRHEVPSVTPVRLELDIDEPGALVFVDGRYAGAGLRELAVAPGQRTLRIEAPGRVPRTTNLEVAPGPATRLSISLDPDPVRVAVGEALASFNERTLAAAAKAPAADLLRSRLVASVPLYEQVLGVATGGSGGDALVFGDSAMWVHTTSSSLSNVPRSHALRYADFARQPLPAHHAAFEVTLSPQLVVNTAGLHVSKERLIEFIAALHARLRATVPPGP